jgi:hypothetical protein
MKLECPSVISNYPTSEDDSAPPTYISYYCSSSSAASSSNRLPTSNCPSTYDTPFSKVHCGQNFYDGFNGGKVTLIPLQTAQKLMLKSPSQILQESKKEVGYKNLGSLMTNTSAYYLSLRVHDILVNNQVGTWVGIDQSDGFSGYLNSRTGSLRSYHCCDGTGSGSWSQSMTMSTSRSGVRTSPQNIIIRSNESYLSADNIKKNNAVQLTGREISALKSNDIVAPIVLVTPLPTSKSPPSLASPTSTRTNPDKNLILLKKSMMQNSKLQHSLPRTASSNSGRQFPSERIIYSCCTDPQKTSTTYTDSFGTRELSVNSCTSSSIAMAGQERCSTVDFARLERILREMAMKPPSAPPEHVPHHYDHYTPICKNADDNHDDSDTDKRNAHLQVNPRHPTATPNPSTNPLQDGELTPPNMNNEHKYTTGKSNARNNVERKIRPRSVSMTNEIIKRVMMINSSSSPGRRNSSSGQPLASPPETRKGSIQEKNEYQSMSSYLQGNKAKESVDIEPDSKKKGRWSFQHLMESMKMFRTSNAPENRRRMSYS